MLLVTEHISTLSITVVDPTHVLMFSQGTQLILDLQNTARHQSLLVENHQALLLQTSRIAGHLQDITKNPEAASQ